MNSQILKLHLSLEDSCAGKIKKNEEPSQILNYISFSNRDQALKRMECTIIINVNRWFQNSRKLYTYLKGSGHHQCSCSLPLCCRPNGELSNQKLLPSHKHTHTNTMGSNQKHSLVTKRPRTNPDLIQPLTQQLCCVQSNDDRKINQAHLPFYDSF